MGSFAELHSELKTDFEFFVYMCLPKMQVKCAEVGSFAELHSKLKTDFEFFVCMCG